MSEHSRIEWTGSTWNPVTGCNEISAGCDHCYARTFAERWRGTPGHPFEQGFDVRLWPQRLDVPLRWRKPRLVFVNSMSDLFHDEVPTVFIARVFAVMAATPRHTYQILTKRHGRMRALLSSEIFRQQVMGAARDHSPRLWLPSYLDGGGLQQISWPLPNVWVGVSVEDQRWAGVRVPALLDTPAAVRWLSCEPLLGPIDLTAWTEGHGPWSCTRFGTLCLCGAAMLDDVRCSGGRVDWVVCGGESGAGARPVDLGWFRALRDVCAASGAAFFCKQLGSVWARERGARGKGGDMAVWPVDLRVRQMPVPYGPRYPVPAPAEAPVSSAATQGGRL